MFNHQENLFNSGIWTLSAGDKSNYIINCEKLSDGDVTALADMLRLRLPCEFRAVVGIPTGGSRLANAMKRFAIPTDDSLPTLLVDDVYTTGKAMYSYKEIIKGPIMGGVIFARAEVPKWITCIFQVTPELF